VHTRGMERQVLPSAFPQRDEEWGRAVKMIPVDLESTARSEGALQRRRVIRSASILLRLVLAYCLCDWSFRIVGAWATTIGLVELSDVDVLERLRKCRAWLSKIVYEWLVGCRKKLAERKVRIRVVDASSIGQPGSKGTDWRIHLTINLGTGCLDGVEVTDAKGGETLVRHPMQAGDIIVADRGYAHRRGLGRALAQGARVVVRINWQNLPLEVGKGEPLDLIAWLREVPELEAAERVVWVETPDGRFELRLVAKRLSQAAAEAARRRIRQEAKKKGRTPDDRTLEAAGYIFVVTNLSSEEWSASDVLELYRLRWQVEMQIKRLKSVLDLDHLRAKDPRTVQVYLLGKVLGALMADDFTGTVVAQQTDWFESLDRPVSPWRLLVIEVEGLRAAVRSQITLEMIEKALPKLGRYLRDSPRKRKQQLAQARALALALNVA